VVVPGTASTPTAIPNTISVAEPSLVVKALLWLWAQVLIAVHWLVRQVGQIDVLQEALPVVWISGWIVIGGWLYALVPQLYGWLIGWWTLPTGQRQMLGSLSRVLSACWHCRTPVEPALEALSIHLPWPYCWRLRRALASQAEYQVSILEALRIDRVLPGWLIPGAAFAQAGSHADRLAFAQDLGVPRASRPLDQEILAVVCQWALCTVTLWFLLVMVPRKFAMILNDAQVPVPTALQFISDHPLLVLWSVIALLLAVLAAVAGLCTWTWAGRTRRALGRALALATQRGADEVQLARQLDAAGCPGDLVGAGERGEWPALAAAAGWPAQDLPDLVRRLAVADHRAHLRGRIAVVVLRCGTPLVLAVPVGGAAWMVFFVLTYLLEHL
jgi:hypothetical protein